MTEYECNAIIAQLELVRKNSPYEAHNPRVDDKGRGVVEIVTKASPEAVRRWFAQTGTVVTLVYHANYRNAYTYVFDWM